MAKNPKWQAAEQERLDAEKAYATFMKDPATLTLREEDPDEYRSRIEALNATIEAANKKVRTTPERI